MNRFFLVLLTVESLLVCSCNKGNDNPAPPAVVEVDTLSAGWSKTRLGTSTFGDIVFSDNNTGYVLGTKPYKTVNGGANWDSMNTPAPFYNLALTPNGNLFAVGGKVNNGTNDSISVFLSADGGKSFNKYSTGSARCLIDLFFVDNLVGYVSSSAGELFATENQGLTWKKVFSNTVSNAYSTMYFLNKDIGWTCAANSIYRSDGNANTWKKAATPGQSFTTTGMYATNVNTVYVGTTTGDVLRSTDGGVNFSSTGRLNARVAGYTDFSFVNEAEGYLCYGNKIYKTVDHGNSWHTVVSLASDTFVEIHFSDANHGWASGYNGLILQYKK